MAMPIMIQGTMSNAGKSLIAAGLCRIFMKDGYSVAPFKSQNMALNSFITSENLEIGRAQAVQAEACGIEPLAAMNPILLKPVTDMGSQVIVMGKAIGNMKAMDYYKKKKDFIPVIKKAYNYLSSKHDIVVIEGAGSPAEINLKNDDIVNMGMAEIADSPVLLVGDIDRGGVFAQLKGTVDLLERDEQQRIKGFIINKFRGDKIILDPGLDMLKALCGKEVLGVVPFMDVDIEEEDSLYEGFSKKQSTAMIDIAVIRLPKISNFTDFQALELDSLVSVRYVGNISELKNPDVIIIPGTKNTITDLRWLRETGIEAAVLKQAEKGTVIFGICGGYQMLGEKIVDSHNTEGGGEIRGMGLLPVITEFDTVKTTVSVTDKTSELKGIFSPLSSKKIKGYEIHMGKSFFTEDYAQSFTQNGGCCSDNVIGTYIHGVFDEEDFRSAFIDMLCGIKGIDRQSNHSINYKEYRNQQYDKLADILRDSLDMEKIYSILKERNRV